MIFLQKNAGITAELHQSSSPEMLDLLQNKAKNSRQHSASCCGAPLKYTGNCESAVLFQGVLLIDCSLGLRANLRLDLLSYPFLTGEGS